MGGIVVTVTIVGGVATLQSITGTDSATSYSLAENGASIVYTRHHDLRLFKVPIAGGTPVPTPVQRTVPDTGALLTAELAGVSCRGTTCIAAIDGVYLTGTYSAPYSNGAPCPGVANPCGIFAAFLPHQAQLLQFDLGSGASTVLRADGSALIYALPMISPLTGDLVVQRGGVWGHLQTYATTGRGNGELHLLKGVVP